MNAEPVRIHLIPTGEFDRLRAAPMDRFERTALVADMCRLNTLNTVKLAGSGHLGSSFSAMDIVAWLYGEEMNTVRVGFDSPERDVYFSSKGHDVPGQYAVLHAMGHIPEEKVLRLRRLGGLDGHPDVGTAGIEANSGSLGMGISKGRGMAWAKRLQGRGGTVYVLTGDGELQEGQNYEALQTTVQQKVHDLVVIVDHNKLQTDRAVADITDLRDLEQKLRAFGWHVARCDGHDLRALAGVLEEFRTVTDRPKILIADTIKGRGVSFMEHPEAMREGQGLYRWHSGAPDDASFAAGHRELLESIDRRLAAHGLDPVALKDVTPDDGKKPAAASGPKEYVADAYGQALLEMGGARPDVVVLDGDLAADCRIRGFEAAHPERFIENGIAEQDMVSLAGGLARQGLLPVVNTFASFLAARANEQIYNNATEKGRVIYACHFAGLIPAGPGKSHQSIRDISLFGALPNVTILQPCNAAETRMVVDHALNRSRESVMIRLAIGPSPRLVELPEGYRLTPGVGAELAEGDDAVLFAYGPVMLHEALLASELLRARGFGLRVVNMPWLNRVDRSWLAGVVESVPFVAVLDDHAPVGGLGDRILEALVAEGALGEKRFRKFAVEGFPACGTPVEVLDFHGLDGASLADRIEAECGFERTAVAGAAAAEMGAYSMEAPQ